MPGPGNSAISAAFLATLLLNPQLSGIPVGQCPYSSCVSTGPTATLPSTGTELPGCQWARCCCTEAAGSESCCSSTCNAHFPPQCCSEPHCVSSVLWPWGAPRCHLLPGLMGRNKVTHSKGTSQKHSALPLWKYLGFEFTICGQAAAYPAGQHTADGRRDCVCSDLPLALLVCFTNHNTSAAPKISWPHLSPSSS